MPLPDTKLAWPCVGAQEVAVKQYYYVADEHNGAVRWMLTDHIGSVRDVVLGDGTVLAHFGRSAFGAVTAATGSVPDVLGYTGREPSENSSLLYYRARFYDPSLGRFTGEDPEAPYGYAYVENSPMSFVDPSGRVAAIEYALLLCDVLSALSFAKGYALTIKALFDNVNAGLEAALAGREQPPQGPVPPPLTPWSLLPCGLGEIPEAF